MKTIRFGRLLAATLALAGLSLSGCNEGPMRTSSPVELIARSQTHFQVVDPNVFLCQAVGSAWLRAIVKRTDAAADTRFLDVRLSSYRVSYRRTDGGTLVPATFTRTINDVIAADAPETPFLMVLPNTEQGGISQNTLLIMNPAALNQAPFVALRGQNGGIDPETGRRDVTLEAIIDFFGETLSGEKVSARTRIEFTVCMACGATCVE